MTPARAALTALAVAVSPFATAATLTLVAVDHITAHIHDRRLEALADELASWTVTERTTPMIPFNAVVALGAIVFAFVNFLKFARAKDWNAVTTQLIVWAGGIAGAFLFSGTQFAHQVHVGAIPLDALNRWSLLVFGLMASSLLTVGNEFRKALDGSDSSVTPTLLPTNQPETLPPAAPTTATPVRTVGAPATVVPAAKKPARKR